MSFSKIPLPIASFCFLLVVLGTGCTAVRVDQTPNTVVQLRGSPVTGFATTEYVHRQEPDYFTYQELLTLVHDPQPDDGMAERLDRFWRTPIISNEAYHRGVRPQPAENSYLGPFLRVATWNIEKSLLMTQAIQAVTSQLDYEKQIHLLSAPPASKRRLTMLRQRERLAGADIIFLQEMDIGVTRSGYINAAEEMANALGMNYAYGVQYLEIDPVMMGLEPPVNTGAGSETRPWEVDRSRYKGMFGSAVLSRYPIKHVELHPLATQPYDWYFGEKSRYGVLEKARRAGSEVAFHNQIARELKVGGRNFMQVDVDVPGVPGGTLSLINIHLEIKCLPKGRDAQMAEILETIRAIPNPVIMAGDHNSAPSDISNVSAVKLGRKAAINPNTYINLAVNYGTAIGGLYSESRWVVNTSKNYHSPLAWSFPVILPNPVRPMFQRIEDFRFDDGTAFDFRGARDRSINGRTEKLANSNQKDIKGQVTSFAVKRPIGPLGLYRLDWVFVKSFLHDSNDRRGPYRLAPHFGETLMEFNKYLTYPISDHRPSMIDVPLQEPPLVPVQPAPGKPRP